mmetsp:Transcript_25146/g.50553  ORF Transcript_25146/g.50553 Transcript_25146/m.50553 type:complete len:161 (-) Transcript_25146:34-516(-)
MGCGGSKEQAYPPPPEPENKPLQLPTPEEIAAQKRKEEADAINAKIAAAPKPAYQSEEKFERKFHKARAGAKQIEGGKRHIKPKRVVGDNHASHVRPSEVAKIRSAISTNLANNRLSRAITRRTRTTRRTRQPGGEGGEGGEGGRAVIDLRGGAEDVGGA